MLKELGHFMRHGREVTRMQRQLPRAEFFDWMTTKADEQGYAEVRRELVGDLEGRVLEIGCGTGAMFPYYGNDARVDGIEPEADFLDKAVVRAAAFGGRIRATHGDGMKLAHADHSFDAVVFGLVLCSVPSVEQVVSEAFRVLKPGGIFRALEHVRSEAAVAGFLMTVTNPLWMKINKQGCRLNRNPLGAIQAAGFQLDDVMAFQRFDTLFPAFPMRRVRAHKLSGAMGAASPA